MALPVKFVMFENVAVCEPYQEQYIVHGEDITEQQERPSNAKDSWCEDLCKDKNLHTGFCVESIKAAFFRYNMLI